jgi:hypothetical protein
MDRYRRVRTKTGKKPPQRVVRQGHTAGGGRHFGSCHVDEHRAPTARDPRPYIVVNFDNDIVQGIFTPQSVPGLARRYPDRPVVAPVGRVFAPSVRGSDRLGRQHRPRSRDSVGTPPQPHQPVATRGSRAVSFPLIGLDAGAANGHFSNPWPRQQPALPAIAGSGAQVQIRKRGPMHLIS